jgi:N-methylhydantoinase B/oxoprolinase/acetone carboxylase alpha subunit
MNSLAANRMDAISIEVVRTRLEAIVEEMGATMLRTAHSSIFYESRDFSVALLNRAGDLVAMGQYIPHHQGGMQAALKSIIEVKGYDGMRPGDIFLTNDAYRGGTHTADFNLFMPIFVEGELIMFCGATAHQIDIGGMVLGAYCVGATSVYQEGIRFPQIKAGEQGEFFDDFMRTFQINVRMPKQQRGDLKAMLAALKVGAKNVPGVIIQHGTAQFGRIVADILDMSERRARVEIDRIPDGVYRYTDYIDHDGVNDRVYKIECAMMIEGSNVTIDFTGTDRQADGFINASYPNTLAACYAAFILFLDPAIPRNSGFFRPIRVIAPEGTLVHPVSPAPIGGSTTEVGGRVYDVVIGCLSTAWPEKALGTWSMMWLGVFIAGTHPDTGQLFVETVLDGLGTGGGARINSDGLNATCIAASNVLIPNVEIEEEFFPVRFLRREIKADTGGPGRFRGGCALETEIELLADCDSTILGSRFKNAPPQGIHGGKHGGPSIIYLIASDGTVTDFPPKITGVRFKKGDRLVMRPCGGGGLGDPARRERWRIEQDLRLGYLTLDAAARDYGYKLDAAE